jgi:hypothetical protein
MLQVESSSAAITEPKTQTDNSRQILRCPMRYDIAPPVVWGRGIEKAPSRVRGTN